MASIPRCPHCGSNEGYAFDHIPASVHAEIGFALSQDRGVEVFTVDDDCDCYEEIDRVFGYKGSSIVQCLSCGEEITDQGMLDYLMEIVK